MCAALVTPAASHPEVVPSPQSNRYTTALPVLDAAPPVVYAYVVPTMPVTGPFGADGGEMVLSAETLTVNPADASDLIWVSVAHRVLAVTT